MSAPPRTRRLVFLLLGLLGMTALRPAEATPSSYSVAPDGAKVLFYFLQDLGYQTSRSFDLESMDPSCETLVMLGPLDGREGYRVLDWVKRGHVLLLAPPLLDEEGYCKDFQFGQRRFKRQRGITNVLEPVKHAELKLHASACVLETPKQGVPLAGERKPALAFEETLGKGRLLVLAHDDLLTNWNLDRDELVVLIRRWLLEHVPRGSRVVFYEGKQGGQLLDLLRRANLVPFALHILVFLLLLYWSLAPRFGNPMPVPDSARRAFAQHARALGALYRHRGASAQMLRHLYNRFVAHLLGRVERRNLLTPTASSQPGGHRRTRPQLARLIATRTGRDANVVESLLAQVEYAVGAAEQPDPRDVQRHYRLSQSLAALRSAPALTRRARRRR